MTPEPSHLQRRSGWVVSTAVVLGVLGASAVPSGLMMLIGGTEVFPARWVDDFPIIDSLVLPGLVLLFGFGVGSLVTAYGVLRRPDWPALAPVQGWTGHHWSWLATALIGLGQLIWILLEFVYLTEVSFLQPLYGAVGLLLVVLPFVPAVSAELARPTAPADDVGRAG